MITNNLNININIEDNRWQKNCPYIKEIVKRAIKQTYSRAIHNLPQLKNMQEVFVNIELSCDKIIQELNFQYRNKNSPTNVLSFPQLDTKTEVLFPEIPVILGDIILAFETCQREAKDNKIKFVEHLCHLVIHGSLHLLGFDHIKDKEAKEMEKLETNIMLELGYGNPYLGVD